VQITFDPAVISFRDLLEVFFAIHDPTTLNRQGADVGTQYRSVIFHHTSEQETAARQVIAEVNSSGHWGAPLVTELAPFANFFPAEGYHQNYFELHGNEPYCQAVIAPKVAKFRKRFLERLK
jgi:peptide-methionine (S)-S-oxide reductase